MTGPAARALRRDLGPWASASIVVGTIIGTGVFLKTAVMAQLGGSPMWVLAAWGVAGALSFTGAMTYAELGGMFPAAGGEYVYLRRGYSPFMGYLYAWNRFWIATPGSIAAYAVGSATFFSAALAARRPAGSRSAGSAIDGTQVVALGLIVVFTAINCLERALGRLAADRADRDEGRDDPRARGRRAARAARPLGQPRAARRVPGVERVRRDGARGAVGVRRLEQPADGGRRDPRRAGGTCRARRSAACSRCSRSTRWSTSATSTRCRSPRSRRSSSDAYPRRAGGGRPGRDPVPRRHRAGRARDRDDDLGDLGDERLDADRRARAVRGRRDGLAPAPLARLSAGASVPAISVLVQGALSCVLALSGSFDQLTDAVVFASWLFYALNAGSVLLLRRREPGRERPFRVPGFPIVPIVFIALAILLIVNTIWTTPGPSALGLAMTALGAVVYAVFLRNTARPLDATPEG